MTRLSDDDRRRTIERYTERYREHGYAPATLGWDKGRQPIRFDVLTSRYDFAGKRVLDIGCGFGDLNRTLEEKFGSSYAYLGVELVPALADEARRRWRGEHIQFRTGDFLELDLTGPFDFALASGVFNHRLLDTDGYEIIEATMTRAFSLCRDGLAFDFLSDRVDRRHEHTFHSSPERILAMAYSLSRNVVLRNDYMPFEFSVFVFRDDSFDPDDAVFHRFRAITSGQRGG